jgi:hypothetical protein
LIARATSFAVIFPSAASAAIAPWATWKIDFEMPVQVAGMSVAAAVGASHYTP